MQIFLHYVGQEVSLWLQAVWNKIKNNSRRASFSKYRHWLSRLST